MNTAIKNAIEELQKILDQKNQEIFELKKTINTLCVQNDEPILYENLEKENVNRIGIQPDEFVGLNIALAVEKFLKIKGTSATLDDIYESLKRGGYTHSGSDTTVQKRNLSISLANPKFLELPNGTFGLKEKYGITVAKRKKGLKKAKKRAEDEVEENGDK